MPINLNSENKISIIIPCFCAENFIKGTIEKTRKVFGEEIEIIVVINEPRENTLLIVKKIFENDKYGKVLYFGKRIGKGRAILEGFKVANGRILGFMDADAPFKIETIRDGLDQLFLGKCDCLIFSKWEGCAFWRMKQNFFRKCSSRFFNLLVRNLFNLDFKDTQGGAKFIKKDVIEKIGYDFICDGFVFDVELLLKLVQKGMIVKEFPIENYPVNFSTVAIFRDLIPVLADLLRLRNRFPDAQKSIKQF